MKKLLLYAIMGLIAVSAVNAAEKDVTLKLKHTMQFQVYEPYSYWEETYDATAKVKMTYDETNKQYVFPGFLGYVDANGQPIDLKFSFSEEADANGKYHLYAYDPNLDPKKTVAENTNNYYEWANAVSGDLIYYNRFYLPLENAGGAVDFETHKSGVIFSGSEYDYKLYNPLIWIMHKDNPGNILFKTYAKKNSEGLYDVVIYISGGFIRKSVESDEWPTSSYSNENLFDHWFDMSFTIPADINAGVDDIIADSENNAPVEYFNLQGVKVENPSNGLYIVRQGNKVSKQVIR